MASWSAARLRGLVVAAALVLAGGAAQAARPRYGLSVDSLQGYPLVVHGAAGQGALLARIRDAADRAWRAEIVDAGWPAPPADPGGPDGRFDIYVDPSIGEGEGYVLPEAGVPATPWDDSTSYMGLPASFASDAALYSMVAHELNHASQFGIDALESDAFFEHSAVFVEQRVANDFATYGVGIADFQAHPERALDWLQTDYYEYGASLWLMYLSERLGDGGHRLVQRLWLDAKQTSGRNRPTWLDALDGILAEQGWTRARFFASFAVARYFTGARAQGVFRVGADWGPSSQMVAEARALGDAPLQLSAQIGAMGAHLVDVDLAPGVAAIAVQGGQPEQAVALQPLDAEGRILGEPLVVAGAGAATFALPAGSRRLIVGMTALPAGYDSNAMAWTAHPVAVTLAPAAAPDGGALDAGAPDAGAVPPGGGGGCATATHADAGPLTWLALAAVAAALALATTRRRRRRDVSTSSQVQVRE